jgi:Uncharacterized conserved protein (DUF2278)
MGDEMPLASYGVLVGSVVDQRAEGGTDSPHYQIRVRGSEADFRVAVNVLSHSIRVHVAAPVQVGNHGGLITLLNPDGLKVDGVAYTQAQAAAEGWSITF